MTTLLCVCVCMYVCMYVDSCPYFDLQLALKPLVQVITPLLCFSHGAVGGVCVCVCMYVCA